MNIKLFFMGVAFLLITPAFMLGQQEGSRGPQVISFTSLPKPAQAFVDANFKNYVVANILDYSGRYELIFKGNTSLTFSLKGDWQAVSGRGSEIPTAFIPQIILGAIDSEHASAKVVYASVSKKNYKIHLSDKAEFTIDHDGKVLKKKWTMK